MARFYRKRWFIGLFALFSSFLVLFVALPVLASMRLVDTQLITALEQLTGHTARFSGQPQIGVFPRLHVRIADLTLTPKNVEDAEPIFRADHVQLDLSAWSVINGEIFVQNTLLVRPVLDIPKTNGGKIIPHLLAGDLYKGLRTAEILIKENPTEADLSSIRPFKIGPVNIESGAIRFGNVTSNGEEKPTLSSINGVLSATELNAPMLLNFNAIWKGENIRLNGTVDNLLSLSVGGFSNLKFDLQSAPLEGSFSGNVGLGEQSYAEGKITLSTPSLSSLLVWVDQDVLVSERIGEIVLNANLRARNAQFYFEEAEVTLNDKVGSGSMEIKLEADIPKINATLAFDDLDLRAMVDGLSHSTASDGINMSIAEDVELDLRLSANSAQLEPFNLQNLAASLQIKPDMIGMDINDATLFGGQIQAGLRLNKAVEGQAPAAPNAELKLLASDVDASDLFALAQWDQFILDGPVTLSLITEGAMKSWLEFANSSTGTVTLRAADIAIDGFSLDRFLADLSTSQFFPLTFAGSSAVSVLEAKGAIQSGSIRIDDFTARLGENRIDLSGLYAHAARSLAMAGAIIAVNENGEIDETTQKAEFFVGGSPSRPFISPIIPGRSPDLR